MPIYEYVCSACEHEFEQIQKFSDAPIKVCPSCAKKGRVTKKLSTSAFILSGGGWYKQGYSGPSGGNGKESGKENAATESAPKSDSKGEGKSESSGGETKVEAAGCGGGGCGHCAA